MDIDRVDIWVFELSQPEEVLTDCWYSLASNEKERARSFHTPFLQQAYTISRGFLRSILSQYLNIAEHKLEFIYNEQGKPLLDPKYSIHFNLSHSGNKAIIGISCSGSVGVDIEYIDKTIDVQELSFLVLDTEEQSLFSNLPDDHKHEMFFRIWTRKEAFAKCLGLGFQFDFKNCTVGMNLKPEIHIKKKMRFKKKDWFIQDIDVLDESFKAAIVVSNKYTMKVNIYKIEKK